MGIEAMNTENMRMEAVSWWQVTAFRVNRWYALATLAATAISVGMPFALGNLIPCAQFMEIEWFMVAILCVSGVGLLNIAFSFAPMLEMALPAGARSSLRVLLLNVVPPFIVVGAMWLAFSPFWYALFNDPELLCD